MVINEIQLDGWNDFNREMMNGDVDCIYRGHANPDWYLAANYIRNQVEERGIKTLSSGNKINVVLRSVTDFNSILIKGLSDFKSLVRHNMPELDNDSNDFWWALGQHYGLITPLLDWTQCPYIASFFAIYGFLDDANKQDGGLTEPNKGLAQKNGEVVIWKLNRKLLNSFDVDNSTFHIIEKDKIARLENVNINKRLESQKGLFTFMMHDKYATLEEYFEAYSFEGVLTKYHINIDANRQISDSLSQSDTTKFLIELKRKGITYSKLFPDFVGCSIEANYLQRLPFLRDDNINNNESV